MKYLKIGGLLRAAAIAFVLGQTGPVLALDDVLLVAPAAPGGGWDQTARALQDVMKTAGVAKTVTVENVPGAGGTVGLAQFIDKYKGNGNALLVNGLVMVGAILTNNSPVTLEQVTPIARLTGEYEVLVVPASSEVKSLDDLIAKFKADPGSVSWGGGSAGGTDHILAGLIAQAAGIEGSKVNYIPYSGGGEALAAIMGGHVTVGISGLGEWLGQIQSGELRALAISAPQKLEGIDIPTLKEQGIDVELANWRAIVGASGIDDGQKKALLEALDTTVKSDGWKKVLTDKKWMDLYLAGDDFATFLKQENERVAATLKQIGLVK
ncbi:MAG TPA: tripartite tricarboxylate transporter substrate binding protein [Aestuariivirgaceae bacterium]